VQSNYGRADALHRAARAFLIDAMSELMVASTEEGPRLINARTVFRAACAHAAESAVRIVDMLAAEAGAGAIFETSRIERFIRDVHAAVKHIAMSPNSYVVSGRVALGLDPGTPRFLTGCVLFAPHRRTIDPERPTSFANCLKRLPTRSATRSTMGCSNTCISDPKPAV